MGRMKSVLAAAVLSAGLAFFTSAPANAAVVLPDSGASYSFSWSGGLGQIDQIGGMAENEWTITVGSDSFLSSITVFDCCVIGDEFELIVDGFSVAWDMESGGSGTGSLYEASLENLFLSAGSHTITLFLTSLAPGFTTGGGDITFGAITAVPLPAALPLFLFGLGGLGYISRRRKAA